MRRLLASLPLVALLGCMVGCHMTHGICDCDIPGHKCCYQNCAWHHLAPGVGPIKAEPIKAELIPAKPMPADAPAAPAPDATKAPEGM